MPVTLRADKGATLTFDEVDGNWVHQLAQTAHGFVVGDLVYPNSAITWAKAQANAGSTLADGIALFVEDANTAWIATLDGTVVTVAAHGLGADLASLYLSQGTAGLATTTQPSSGLIQPVGKVLDSNTLLFRLGPVVSI